ncbi:MAG: alpha/beta fold hydrolase [Kofleriaceae bacterium]
MTAALLLLAAVILLASQWGLATLSDPPHLWWERAPRLEAADGGPAVIRRAQRPAVVLAHGLAGFDSIGLGALRVEYFRNVARDLERRGYDVLSPRVPPVGALPERAAALADAVSRLPHERVTIVGHSMGGLDARWAISHGLAPRVADLVTIGTPHRGTPLADLLSRRPAAKARRWMAGVGLPTDAIEWLTTWRLAELAEQMVDAAEVRYTSVVGVVPRVQVHPLLLAPYLFLSVVSGPNDGMVPLWSQRWGTVLASEPMDHLAQIGWSGDAAALVRRSLDRLRLLSAGAVTLTEPLALLGAGELSVDET